MPIIPLLRSSVYGGSTVRLVAWLLLFVCFSCFFVFVLSLFCVCSVLFVWVVVLLLLLFSGDNCIFNGEGEGLTSEQYVSKHGA